MKLLIGILVIDRPKMTDKCFEHLIQNTDMSQVEIVVVDNNSNGLTKSVLDKYEKYFHCRINNIFNHGTAFGVNQYMSCRQPGQNVLNVNCDAHILVDDWLPTMLKVINDPDLATVSGRRSSFWSEGNRSEYFKKNIETEERYGIAIEHDKKENQVIFPWTMIKGSVIDKLGYMNEATCIDDIDYTSRIWGMGLKNVYVPEVVIWQPRTQEQHDEGQNHLEYTANKELILHYLPTFEKNRQEYEVFKVKLYKGSRFIPGSITEEFYQRASDRNYEFFKNYSKRI
jgi:GT2 family glycosyltransferase